METRQWVCLGRISEFAKTRVLIECPFCKEQVWAYTWSLGGCGKRCPKCGAVHTQFCSTKKERKA